MSKREILFRGKRVDNGEWIDGWFLPGNERQSLHPCIFVYLPETQSFECFDIDIDTLGEYTGLTDRDGTRIFEGDIIGVVYNPNYGGVAKKRIGTFKVGFEDGCYVYEDGEGYFLFTESDEIVVIGNIYDNPELLKGE